MLSVAQDSISHASFIITLYLLSKNSFFERLCETREAFSLPSPLVNVADPYSTPNDLMWMDCQSNNTHCSFATFPIHSMVVSRHERYPWV